MDKPAPYKTRSGDMDRRAAAATASQPTKKKRNKKKKTTTDQPNLEQSPAYNPPPSINQPILSIPYYSTSPAPSPLPSIANENPWSVVSHRSRTSSISSTSSNAPIIKTFLVSGLPMNLRSPKALGMELKKIPGLLVSDLTVYFNGIAAISSPGADLREKLVSLGHQLGQPLKIESKRSNTTTRTPPKAPVFSCVLRGVELDIDAGDIRQATEDAGLTITNAWRIRSRATDEETRLCRITTTCKKSLDILLSRGLTMFHHVYPAEASHPPKPQPVQCARCLKFTHPTSSCQERRPICGLCGGGHAAPACKEQAVAKCGNCGGDHVAFSTKCPARPSEAATPATAAPMKTTDAPDQIPPPNDPTIHAVIRFVTHSLINLFPNQRQNVHRVLKPLIWQFFGLQIAASYSGSWIHVTLV